MPSLDDLIKKAIELKETINLQLTSLNSTNKEFLDTSSLKNKSFFCINNTFVLFYLNDSLFLIPYFKPFLQILEDNSFTFVDYSKSNNFIDSLNIIELFLTSSELFNYSYLAKSICTFKGIKQIPDKYKSKCFKIPLTGIEIVESSGKNFIYYPTSPLIEDSFWNKIGTFNMLNSTICFINSKGDTYVSYDWGICSTLSNVGYTKDPTLFVPLSHGEHIANKDLDIIWQSIKY